MGDRRKLCPAFIAEHPETGKQYYVNVMPEVVPYQLRIGNPLEKMVDAYVASFEMSRAEMGGVLRMNFKEDQKDEEWQELYFHPPDEFTEEGSASLKIGDKEAVILTCIRYMGQDTYEGAIASHKSGGKTKR